MHKKRVLLTVLIVLFVFAAAAACGRTSGTPTPPPDVSPEDLPPASEPVETPEPEPVSVILTAPGGSELTVFEYDTEVFIADSAFIPGLVDNAALLPAIRSIRLEDGLDFSLQDIDDLQAVYPEAEIIYRVVINGKELSLDSTVIDLSSLPAERIAEAVRELKKLPFLQKVELTPAASVTGDAAKIAESKTGAVFNDNLTIDQIAELAFSRPDVIFDYKFLLYGKTVSTADERLEYVDVKIGDDGVDSVIRPIMPAMSNLKYLKLDRCEVKSPVMAQLRDDYPDVKVVWRIYFSNYGYPVDGVLSIYNCLTDTEKVWGTGFVSDFYAEELKYCTDVKYLDLGHNCITNVDFVRYMPDLEVAILSVSWLESLEPLASCPKLEYLECFSTNIEDLSPLAACTNLKHLNIGSPRAAHPFTDLSPLYGLDLERLYCTSSKIPVSQQEEFKTLHPECECEFGLVSPDGKWKFLDGNSKNNVPSNRTEMYAKISEIFGYDTYSYSR